MRQESIDAFFALLRAGLWETDNGHTLSDILYDDIDWNQVYRIAEEQGVVGLVAAGIEILNVQVPLDVKLQLVGSALQIEQRNKAMNAFIAEQVEAMRKIGIYTLLVKGQGLAQCYIKPLWRPSGDIDFLLSDDNYKKAVDYMLPISSGNKPEGKYSKHLGLSVGQWYVELHGTLRDALSSRIDREIDVVHNNVFFEGKVRSWMNGKVQVFLPGVDEDVFFVFTHFIKHLYKEQLSLRQICDWCRLLWTYYGKVDRSLLAKRLYRAGLMGEWHVFAALAVDWLGMSAEAMPLYENARRWNRKASLLISLVFNGSKERSPKRLLELFNIFPNHTLYFLPGILKDLNLLKIKERYFTK